MQDYHPIDSTVLPYIAQIWNSLKYEVRNGEAPEAIQETLLVFEAAASRLADHSDLTALKEYVDTIWSDCSEDFYDNPAYTERLGSILVSVARVNLAPFRLVSPRVVGAVKRTILQSKSPAHTKSLLLVLNNLLRARRQVLPPLSPPGPAQTYGDEPLRVILDLYFKVLQDNAVPEPSKEQTDISKEACEGLSQIVQQRRISDNGTEYTSELDDAAFKEVCATLTYHCLNAFSGHLASPESTRDTVEEAASQALQTAVRYYPQGYGRMVSGVLDEITKRSWTSAVTERSFEALESSLNRLSFIGCAAVPEDAAPIINFAAFAGSMLRLLAVLSGSQASLRACTCVLKAILRGIYLSINAARTSSMSATGEEEKAWTLASVDTAIKDILPTFPDIIAGAYDQFDPTQLTQLMTKGTTKVGSSLTPFLQLGVYVVAQLYQHATTVTKESAEGLSLELRAFLKLPSPAHEDHQSQEAFLVASYIDLVASAAATVLQELSVSAQLDLRLHENLLACFHLEATEALQKGCWSSHRDEMISGLSWGIARAIRSEIVLQLVSKTTLYSRTARYILMIVSSL